MAGSPQATERVDLECCLCLELLCEPLQLPCSHVFCRRCIAHGLRENRQCALCRATIPESFDPAIAPVHQPLEQILMRQCTVEYMQRIEDVALEAARIVRLHVANDYEMVSLCPRPKHRWTVTVGVEAQPDSCLPKGSVLPDIIKHVRFGLPPACRVVSYGSHEASENEGNQVPPSYVEVCEGPFQITATSPMSCTIVLIIIWQDWIGQPPLQLQHELNFTRDGGCWDYGVDLHAAFVGNSSTSTAHVSEPIHASFSGMSRPPLLRSESRIADVADTVAHKETPRRSNMISSAMTGMRRNFPKLRSPLTRRA